MSDVKPAELMARAMVDAMPRCEWQLVVQPRELHTISAATLAQAALTALADAGYRVVPVVAAQEE